ncbi:MAG TPA: hypothetical protein VJT16_11740 [Streptosporangiaceae bacterium]|nr:hypothetical protein [Streptosporangiaceae bacterium]
MSQDGPQNAQQRSDTRHSAPAMPRVPRSEVYRGSPRLLLDSSVGYNVGWQEDRKAGPSFVVVQTRGYMTSKVTERFPMTEEGWSLAWDALVGHDPASAERILAILENREARQRVRDAHTALDDETLCMMRSVTFNGGTCMAPLAKGQTCDLRFMSDKVMVCAHRSADAIIEMPYRDVRSVDVTSSNTTRPGAQIAAVILILALQGAVLGIHIKGVRGAVIGGLIAALVGCLIGWAWSQVESNVRLLGRDAEYYFLASPMRPEVLRTRLSNALAAIHRVHAEEGNDSDHAAGLASAPFPDQLGRLGSLLQQGLITRDEFELLKARLIEQP